MRLAPSTARLTIPTHVPIILRESAAKAVEMGKNANRLRVNNFTFVFFFSSSDGRIKPTLYKLLSKMLTKGPRSQTLAKMSAALR